MFGRYKTLRTCETFDEADVLRALLHDADLRSKVRDLHGVPGVQLLVEEDEFEQADAILNSAAVEDSIPEIEEAPALPDTAPPKALSLDMDTPLPELSTLTPTAPGESLHDEEAPRAASWDDLALRAAEHDLEPRHPLGEHPAGDDWCELLRLDDPETAEFYAAVFKEQSIAVGVTGAPGLGRLPGVALTSSADGEESVLYVGQRDLERAQAILAEVDASCVEEESEAESNDEADDTDEGAWAFLAEVETSEAALELDLALRNHGISTRLTGTALNCAVRDGESDVEDPDSPSILYVGEEDSERASVVLNRLITGALQGTGLRKSDTEESAVSHPRMADLTAFGDYDQAEFYRAALAEHDIEAKVSMDGIKRFTLLVPESNWAHAYEMLQHEIETSETDKDDTPGSEASAKPPDYTGETGLPPLDGIPYARTPLSAKAAEAFEELRAQHAQRQGAVQRERGSAAYRSGGAQACPECGSARIDTPMPKALHPAALIIMALLIMFFTGPFACVLLPAAAIGVFFTVKKGLVETRRSCLSCGHKWR